MNETVTLYLYFTGDKPVECKCQNIEEAKRIIAEKVGHDGYMILDSAGECISYMSPSYE